MHLNFCSMTLDHACHTLFRYLASALCCYMVLLQHLRYIDVDSTCLHLRYHMQFSCRSRAQAQ